MSNAFTTRCLVFLASFLFLGVNETAFIGAERCKLCHRPIYVSWRSTAHARATDSLGAESPSPSCLRCHTTGPAGFPGVQCESCHGAGGNYWPAEVMIDPVKVRDAGLIEPSERTCRACHGSALPGHARTFEMPEPGRLSFATH